MNGGGNNNTTSSSNMSVAQLRLKLQTNITQLAKREAEIEADAMGDTNQQVTDSLVNKGLDVPPSSTVDIGLLYELFLNNNDVRSLIVNIMLNHFDITNSTENSNCNLTVSSKSLAMSSIHVASKPHRRLSLQGGMMGDMRHFGSSTNGVRSILSNNEILTKIISDTLSDRPIFEEVIRTILNTVNAKEFAQTVLRVSGKSLAGVGLNNNAAAAAGGVGGGGGFCGFEEGDGLGDRDNLSNPSSVNMSWLS